MLLSWSRHMQYIVAFNMLVNSRDSFVTAQHKNKLYKSVEKGLTYEIDTKQKEKKGLTKTHTECGRVFLPRFQTIKVLKY